MMKNKLITILKQYEMSFAWVMLYFYDQVVMGKYQNEELILMSDNYDEALCFQVHMFNQEKELRSGNDFNYIEIKSPKNEKYYMVEEFHVLGNKTTVEGDSTTFTQYGRSIKLPLIVEKQGVNHGVKLVVHHLFDEETGYVKGYRLVDIKGGK